MFEHIMFGLLAGLKKLSSQGSRSLRKLRGPAKKPVIVLEPAGEVNRYLKKFGNFSPIPVRNTNRILFVFLFIGLLVSACSPAAEGTDLDLPDTGDLTQAAPQAVDQAVLFLSDNLGVEVQEIQVLDFERVDWSNACLELAAPDEVCAEAVTPGFRVVLEANGQQYVLHTDEQGNAVRLE
jgi:hypothetical protein